MPRLRDTVRPHPTTVSRVAALPKRRGPRVREDVRHAVESVRVDTRVWAEALRLAGGDATRLIVESATSVLVTNSPRKGNKRARNA